MTNKTQLKPITNEEDWLKWREPVITSTESSSLFGLQMASLPTAFELWHLKRGLIDSTFEVNNYMQWGRIFESAILEVIKDDNPDWIVSPLKVFACDDEMGSSFDNTVKHPERGVGILEIKMTTYREYKEKFIEDDDTDFIECPAYYEVQGQHELECLDKYDYICFAIAIVDTREIKYIFRERDKYMGNAIRDKITAFWESKEPPPPDMIKDSDLLAKMHRANNKDSAYDGTEDAEFLTSCISYIEEGQKEKAAKEAKEKLRSEIILAMKDHNTAWTNGYRVGNKASFRVTKNKGK